MAPKPKKITDADKARLKKLAAGKGALANGKLSMDQQLELSALKRMDRQSKSYSPAPMSAAAKKKAAARGKETAAKTKPKSTVSKVVKRVKTVAREAGDVKKAVKNVAVSAKSALNLDRTGNQYLGRQAVRETGKDLGKQLKELGSAVKSGKPGKRAGNISYNDDTGTPQGLKAKPRPKYGVARPPYKTGKGFGPYPKNK